MTEQVAKRPRLIARRLTDDQLLFIPLLSSFICALNCYTQYRAAVCKYLVASIKVNAVSPAITRLRNMISKYIH